MDKAEFDRFADEYRLLHARNVRLSGEDPEYFAEYKVKDLALHLRSSPESVLDFGSGIGTSVPWLRKYFPSAALTCLDVSQRSLDIGSARFPEAATFAVFDGHTIPAESETFDVIFTACVFHHIDTADQVALLAELRRVLKRGGAFALFEHNPWNPLTRWAVNACPFDESAVLIRPSIMRARLIKAGFTGIQTRFRVFFPGFLRHARPLESALYWCPLGAQYSVFASRA